MKKQKKKLIFYKQMFGILFLFLFFINATSCQNRVKKEIEIEEKPNSYEVQICNIDDIFTSSIYCLKYKEEQFYIAGSANEKKIIGIFNTQGQYLDEIVLSFTDIATSPISIEDFFIKKDGSIACIYKIWNKDANDLYFYTCFDQNGTEYSKFELPTSKSVSDIMIEEDKIYLLTDQELSLWNEQGILLEQYKIKKEKALHLVIDKNETIYIVCYSPSNNIIIKQINSLEKKIKKEYNTGLSLSSLKINSCWISSFTESTAYDLIAANGTGVYGLDEKGNTIQLFTWTDCNTFIQDGSSLDFISFGEERYALLCNNGIDGNCFYLISKQEKKQKPKTKLVLYVYSQTGVPNNIKLAVIGWNQQHPDCHITMESNPTHLYFNIVSGKHPDIVVTDNLNDVKDLANKNYFMNYYDIMKEYPEGLQKEELFQPILQLYEIEKDTLYSLPIGIRNFSLLAGKTTDIQDRKQWNLQDISDLIEQKPIGTRVMSNILHEKVYSDSSWNEFDINADQKSFFLHLYSHSFYDFYDTITGFHRDTFQNLLDFTERWCLDSQDISPEENPSLLWYCNIENSYTTLLILEELQKLFGKNGYDFIGYPCENGTGIGVKEYLSFSITANGTDTKAAWDFVQSFCSQEAQTYKFGDKNQPFFIENVFPIRNSAINYQLEQNRKSKIDTTVSKKEIKRLWNFITYADFLWNYEDEVYNIVKEEVYAYYDGEKRQEEMLNILENRVNLYINEKK